MDVLTVTQLNTYIKACFEENRVFRRVFVNGEVSNFKQYASGHCYFTLKDDRSQLKCVMFRSFAERLRFHPEDGLRVLCRGKVSVYERDGVYQLYAEDMQPAGLGALSLAFEQLKGKLEAEGLFAEERKRPLPRYPRRIGIVTSPSGAVIHDICKVLARRFPPARPVLYPVKVQGEGAAAEIVRGIARLNRMADVDLLIVGRGGGSMEDLQAFNAEVVARAVAGSRVPVISAVGHESDYTICDFAADLRAPTPSAAAELAVPDQDRERAYLDSVREMLLFRIRGRIEAGKQELDALTSCGALRDPGAYLELQRDRLDAISVRMRRRAAGGVQSRREHTVSMMQTLHAYHPLQVLSRGYCAASQDGEMVTRAADVRRGAALQLKFADGEVACMADAEKGEV
ncbi:MAG: exodeoxyribonuclease VII large subunit [Clostridiales bacterium]|nr:exodeoxyribonuclease VII large subunit [Clostridiales bacterium]